MLAPFGSRVEAASLPTLLVLIAVFAVGILLSMSLFGVAFARLMSATAVQRLGRAAGGVDGGGRRSRSACSGSRERRETETGGTRSGGAI